MATQSSTSNFDYSFLWYFLIGFLFSSLLLAVRLFAHLYPENIFAFIETVILLVVSGLSAGNYYLTRVAMAQAGTPLEDKHFFPLVIINMLLFGAAIMLVQQTELLTFIVAAIYLAFSVSNTHQVLILASSSTKSEPHFRAIVQSAIWLKEENGLSVVAFTVVLFALLGFTVWHLYTVDTHSQYDNFYFQIKAFAGGAATFHLVVSVSKYLLICMKKDVVETTLLSLKEKVDAHSQSAALQDLFHVSSALTCDFRRSSEWWRRALVKLGTLAIIFAFSSWGLNRWQHNHADNPCPPPKAESQATK